MLYNAIIIPYLKKKRKEEREREERERENICISVYLPVCIGTSNAARGLSTGLCLWGMWLPLEAPAYVNSCCNLNELNPQIHVIGVSRWGP